MNDPDNFLNRWSRRKQEAGARKGKKEETAGEPRVESAAESEPAKIAEVAPVPGPAPVTKIDSESLPPIESIGSETDITAFMRKGVPETLKYAALRRAWSSDPAIRDFVGLNENFWDAAGPDGISGFGDLDPNFDVRRMVSELFGETPLQDTQPAPEPDRVADSAAPPAANSLDAVDRPQEPVASDDNLPQRNENVATQTESAEPTQEKKISRRHGGAMPQ